MKLNRKRNKSIKFILIIIIIIMLIFASYLINRYLIPKVETKVTDESISEIQEKCEITENTYKSKEIEIKIEKKNKVKEKIK